MSPVAVVTGSTSGIGLAAAVGLARRGWVVGLVGRDPVRLAMAVDLVRREGPEPVPFSGDLTDFASVRALAGAINAAFPNLDLLACNAGGTWRAGSTTVDGYDKTLQVNHLSHFLLANLLRDKLAGGRIVNTASAVYGQGRLDPAGLTFTSGTAYPAAKQANVLFTLGAATRWPEIVSAAFHPGVVRTRFASDDYAVVRFFFKYYPFLRTPERGADTLLWLATEPPEKILSGGYYRDRRLVPAKVSRVNERLADTLWTASEEAVRER